VRVTIAGSEARELGLPGSSHVIGVASG
jgi:hypothetical protein